MQQETLQNVNTMSITALRQELNQCENDLVQADTPETSWAIPFINRRIDKLMSKIIQHDNRITRIMEESS